MGTPVRNGPGGPRPRPRHPDDGGNEGETRPAWLSFIFSFWVGREEVLVGPGRGAPAATTGGTCGRGARALHEVDHSQVAATELPLGTFGRLKRQVGPGERHREAAPAGENPGPGRSTLPAGGAPGPAAGGALELSGGRQARRRPRARRDSVRRAVEGGVEVGELHGGIAGASAPDAVTNSPEPSETTEEM